MLVFRGVILEFASPSCFIPRFRWGEFSGRVPACDRLQGCLSFGALVAEPGAGQGVSGSDVEGHDPASQSVIQKHV